jgi:hypothetical protein
MISGTTARAADFFARCREATLRLSTSSPIQPAVEEGLGESLGDEIRGVLTSDETRINLVS